MNRMWEIRESDPDYKYGYKMGKRMLDPEEAYECGFEDGYKKAMQEIKYGERTRRY